MPPEPPRQLKRLRSEQAANEEKNKRRRDTQARYRQKKKDNKVTLRTQLPLLRPFLKATHAPHAGQAGNPVE